MATKSIDKKKTLEYAVAFYFYDSGCVNFMMEATNYVWETDRITGLPTDKPIDDFCHLMDAFRYGMEDINSETFSW